MVSHMSMLVRCYEHMNLGTETLVLITSHCLPFHVTLHDCLMAWNLSLITCEMRMVKAYLLYQVAVSSQ